MTRQHNDDLHREVDKRRWRRERWQREGERSLGRNLAMIGSLGWLIVTPMLLGVSLGRWIDRAYGTGIFWTASLIFIGLIIGCWLAWKRVQEE